MTPIAENPVVAPDRELKEEKKPGTSEPPRIRCPLCGWSPERKITGSVNAVIRGILLRQAACVPRACTSGLKHSASRAADGRHTQIGMRSNAAQRDSLKIVKYRNSSRAMPLRMLRTA
jgi:hypothetical protein